MTISTTQLLTKVRTWLLVAGLTGLVIALGAVLGGAFLGLFGSLAAMILAPLGATLLQLGVSRQREYLADATAEARPLAHALEQLERVQAARSAHPYLKAA